MLPIPEPIAPLKKIGRITGVKDIDVFWISNNLPVIVHVDGLWYAQKDDLVINTIEKILGKIKIKNIFLSSGYLGRDADSLSYYDIYDCEWSSLAYANVIMNVKVA